MSRSSRPVAGRVVAITGGARGIGRATAALLSREGARVAIGDVDAGAAERTAAELGGGVRAYPLDVTRRASFERFLSAVERDLGPLDVLVNNAGIMLVGPFLEEDEAATQRQLDINLGGVLTGMRLALPRMLARRQGHLVNVASSAGKTGVPGIATYAASKHAVVGLTEAVRMEHPHSGVDFSVVMPSVVNTELARGARSPRGVRMLEPEDVAREVLAVLQRPELEVYVPRSLAPLTRLSSALPYLVRERIGRLLGVDRVMMDADRSARSDYEKRAVSGEPQSKTPAA